MIRSLFAGQILIASLIASSAALAGELAGVVLDQDGKPVAHAVVAAIPWETQRTADGEIVRHITHSDDAGRFRLQGLPAGSYGATAATPALGSAFLGNLPIAKDGVLGNQILRLEAPAVALEGDLKAAGGAVPKDAVVAAMRISDEQGDVFYADIHDKRYHLSLAPGRYVLAAKAQGWESLAVDKTFGAAVPAMRIDIRLLPEYGTSPVLAREIIDMEAMDQKARFAWMQSKDEAREKDMAQIDARNEARVKDIIKEHGWPGAELIGSRGVHALWVLVQHESPEVIKQCLPDMKAAAARGELPWSTVALSIDRDLVYDKKEQRYGSQVESVESGKVVLYAVEDEAHLDERRAEIGLPPIAEYKATVLKMNYPDGAR